MSPPTASDAGAKNAVLTYRVFAYAKSFGGNAFGSNVGFTMPDTAVYSADWAWIAAERWNALTVKPRDSFASLRSCRTFGSSSRPTPQTLRRKLLMIRRFGAAYVALVDSYERTLWHDGTPVPNFAIDLGAICDA